MNGSPLFFSQVRILGFDGVPQFVKLNEAGEKKLFEFSSLFKLVLRQRQHKVDNEEKRDQLEQELKYLENHANSQKDILRIALSSEPIVCENIHACIAQKINGQEKSLHDKYALVRQ